MTDRAQSKETALTPAPAHPGAEPQDREAISEAVRDHRRAVEETVEALKTKIARASDRVEQAKERVDETTDIIREYRWPALGAATLLGLMAGLRRRHRQPPIQLILPSGLGEAKTEQKKRTLMQAAFATVGTIILREVGMRAIAVLEERLVRASNPPEPPVR